MKNIFFKKITPVFIIIFVFSALYFVFSPQANIIFVKNSSPVVLAGGEGAWIPGCIWPVAGGSETHGTCSATPIPGYIEGVSYFDPLHWPEIVILPYQYSCVTTLEVIPGTCNGQICYPAGYSGGEAGLCYTPYPTPETSSLKIDKDKPDWCANPFQYVLSWTYSSTYGQQAFSQVQVSSDNSFSTITYDSGEVANSNQSFTLPASGNNLDYNKTYYCRVKVWSMGAGSNWSSVESFVTPTNAYPAVGFTASSTNPTQFTDQSTGISINQWSWTFQDGTPSTSTSQNPLITFATQGEKTVGLTVKDSNNNSCSTEKTITIPTPPEPPPTPVIPSSSLGSIEPDWCSTSFQYTFNWDLNTTQLAKQIQVSTSSGFSSIIYDSGKVTSSVTSYTLPASGSGLEYNETYYWRVKVWNTEDVVSAWSATQTITTPYNAYPAPNFSWSPNNPGVNKTVKFRDLSIAGSGAVISQWYWNFQDGNPSTSASKDPSVSFTPKGTKTVNLTVTDSNNHSCSTLKSITVGSSSSNKPFWQEIIPW